jgi:hypothetical protein
MYLLQSKKNATITHREESKLSKDSHKKMGTIRNSTKSKMSQNQKVVIKKLVNQEVQT